MHASNLLKAVLKPRAVTSSSSGQTLNSKDSKSRATRASSPDSGLSTLSVSKKSNLAPKPAKMSCLCAPTSHAGSFRCRLHRGQQQSWGGRPLTPPTSPGSKPSPAASPKSPPSAAVPAENGSSKRVVHQPPVFRQPAMTSPPAHRMFEVGRSRLSRVSAATDSEAPVALSNDVVPTPSTKGGASTVRYLKFANGNGCANGAVLNYSMVFIKKLHSSGMDAVQDVFASGSSLSRAGLSL